MPRPVAIVGAGLAGLSCAVHLHRHGVPVRVFEAADAVGGRVRTDEVEGFRLDRGFQVLQTAYPEARRMLDFQALDLRRFEPGALVRTGAGFERITDPFRRPWSVVSMLRSPVATLADKMAVAALRFAVRRGPAHRLLGEPETSTIERLRERGFSEPFIDRFFRPFFGGVFLEDGLETSSRWFELLFRMFSEGDAAIPATGMQAIPEQLAAQLPPGSLQLRAPVRTVSRTTLGLDDGEVLTDAAVLATSEPAAARLLGEELPASRRGRAVHCLAFAAHEPPPIGAVLALGAVDDTINNLCVPTALSPSLAPEGQHLVSATVLAPAPGGGDLEELVRSDLRRWFGRATDGWRLLRRFDIGYALPPQRPGELLPGRPPMHPGGIFRCGDYMETSSIHGALVSGRKTASAVLRALQD